MTREIVPVPLALACDTQLTAARLTPSGRGAVATIRLQGDLSRPPVESHKQTLDHFFRAANGLPLWNQPLGKIAFGQWGVTDPEDLVVCRVHHDVAEIHCHGGDAAVERILVDLETTGCGIVDWREQVAQRTDTLHAEEQETLSRTTTWRTTQIVLGQTGGLLRSAYADLRRNLSLEAGAIERQLEDLLRWSRFGQHLTQPWKVVLTGRPNVGKSSLINALLGYQRAIVFDEPGTTRDVVTGETAFEGWPVTLADTAGLRNAHGEIEAAGIEMARHHLAEADLQVVLVDVSQEPTPDDVRILADWPDALVVAHKADLPDRWGDRLPANAHRVSSVTGQGMTELQQELVRRLIPEIPPPGTPIPLTVRQMECLLAARAGAADDRSRAIERLFVDVDTPCR